LCLANAGGGIVLLGIGEGDIGRGKFSKCPYPNVTPEWIIQRIQDGTVPPVEVIVMDATAPLKDATSSSCATCFAVFVPKSKKVGGHQAVAAVSKIRSGRVCRHYYVAAENDRSKAPVAFANSDALSIPTILWGIQQHKKNSD
jgi:hypothetical protein